MACRLYQKGDTHTVRGVKCTMAKFEAEEVDVQLSNGWFTSPKAAYEDVKKLTHSKGKGKQKKKG